MLEILEEIGPLLGVCLHTGICYHEWLKTSETEIYCLHCDKDYDTLEEGEYRGRLLT